MPHPVNVAKQGGRASRRAPLRSESGVQGWTWTTTTDLAGSSKLSPPARAFAE